jgi:1,4-dihydroxy-2-naphthoate octaprenyltransferase
VLDLRSAIGQVRRNIEQMTAQRQRLSRLVSLATVLVLIRHDSEADEERATTDETLGEYFGESIGRSWTRGLQYLADSIAFVVRMLIGGLIWWVIAIAALLLARHLARRKLAAASEGA